MQRKSSMKKNLKTKLAGIMAGLMAFSSLGGLIAVPTLAAERVEVNGFTLERESETDGWTVVDFDGSTVNAVIPDVVSANGEITEDPSNVVAGSVLYIDESVFDDLKDVETLKLPKWLSGPAKGERYNNSIFTKLENLESYNSNNTGNGYYVEDDALYAGTVLLNYPQSRTGDFSIKEGTTEIDDLAFKNARINTLTVPDADIIINEKSQYDDGTEYFEYTLISASVNNFAGDGCVDGALFSDNGTRLVAYGNDATADLSNITSANPYSFNTVEKLEEISSNISESVLKSTPFTFYSGEQEGRNFITRYFNINGKTAYCYEYGVYNPETVGDINDYNDDITADSEITRNVKKVLFLGYGNDAMDLIAETGISDEAAKNVTGSLIWEYASHITDNNDFVFNASEIYGNDNVSVIQAYYDAIKRNMANVTDEMMADFELGFYNNGEAQNLIVINKVSRPEIPEKPSVTISKQDITTKEELPGAQLTVSINGQVIDSWTSTDTPHVITDLEDGTYTLTEVTAPDGYEIAESIEFTVIDGKVSSDVVVMYDAPEDTYVYISKQDITNNKELPGATLQIVKDGTVIEEWVSTDTPHVIENLADGTYTLVEITAPNGYKVAESITFEVVDGKTSPNPIVMYDEANVATPSEPDKPTTEEPDKPIDGGYSGWEPDEPEETPSDNTDITIIPTEPTETTPPTPTQPEETAPAPEGDRKPIKTGDIMGTLQILFGTMASCGTAGYVIYRKRRK